MTIKYKCIFVLFFSLNFVCNAQTNYKANASDLVDDITSLNCQIVGVTNQHKYLNLVSMPYSNIKSIQIDPMEVTYDELVSLKIKSILYDESRDFYTILMQDNISYIKLERNQLNTSYYGDLVLVIPRLNLAAPLENCDIKFRY